MISGGGTIEPEQRAAARVVGVLYTATMGTAVFAELFLRGQARADAAETARNVAAAERLFRVALVSDLLTYVGVVALVWALYVVLAPVHRNLALLAAFWRLVECAIAGVTTLNAFSVLRLLDGPEYLRALEEPERQALARFFLGLQGAGLEIAFVFLGLGSAVYAVLWLRSRYVPRAVAVWGIVASLLLSFGTLLFVVSPGWGAAVGLAYMLPLGIYEVGLGIWLLVRGIRVPAVA